MQQKTVKKGYHQTNVETTNRHFILHSTAYAIGVTQIQPSFSDHPCPLPPTRVDILHSTDMTAHSLTCVVVVVERAVIQYVCIAEWSVSQVLAAKSNLVVCCAA